MGGTRATRKRLVRWGGGGLMAVGLMAALTACEPEGLTFTVTTTADTIDVTPGDGTCADSGDACSLRAAVMEANALANVETIVLADGATYPLTLTGPEENASVRGDLDITESVTIAGAATIDGLGAHRILDVHDPALAVNLEGVTLRRGRALSGPAVRNHSAAAVTLTDVHVTEQVALVGAPIDTVGGTLTLDSSTVSGSEGVAAAAIVVDATEESPGTLTITNSTISGNESGGVGGAVAVTDGVTAAIRYTTITTNTGSASGGVSNAGGTVSVTASILGPPAAGAACTGPVASGGYNLAPVECSFAATGDSTADPRLNLLGDEGGPTPTHRPKGSSPAVDAIPFGAVDCGGLVVLDQRGAARPANGTCDIGAVEPLPTELEGSDCSDTPNLVPAAQLQNCDLRGLDLANIDLSGADLTGADLSDADLESADLDGATLVGATLRQINGFFTSVQGANAVGADFTGANLTAANLTNTDLTDATLTNATLNSTFLAGADLTGLRAFGITAGNPSSLPASWSVEGSGLKRFLAGPTANLAGLDLGAITIFEADLTGADLAGTTLAGTQLISTDLTGADLTGASLATADTLGTPTSFAQATLTGADLSSFNAPDSDFTGADLTGADLTLANLLRADLTDAVLTGATITTTFFGNGSSAAILTGVRSGGLVGTPSSLPSPWLLRNGFLVGPGADLTGADLTGADLTGADLSGADLTGADLTGATLTGVRSGGIVGSPAALPTPWVLRNGFLVGPGADLSDTDLSDTDLSGTDLTGADLTGATLTGVQSGGIVGAPASLPSPWLLRNGFLVGPEADLTGADLTNADLTGAVITDATVQAVDFGTGPSAATLTGIRSGGLVGTPTQLPAPWELRSGFLIGPGADLAGADLSSLDLSNANLAGADLTGTALTLTNLSNTDLTGADFTTTLGTLANLSGANLTNANLFGGAFTLANLTNTNFTGAFVNGTNFQSATGTPIGHLLATWANVTCPTGVSSNSNGNSCAGQPW